MLIQGCTILDVGGMGVLFTAATVPGDRLVVSGCTIRGCGQAGVSAYKTRAASGWGGYGLVENCLISECNRLAGTPGALGNAACGLHLNDGRRTETDPAHPFILWTFKGNRITGCAAALSPKNEDSGGIAVDFNAHGASIIENVIVGNWGKGGYALNANSTQWIRNVFVGNDSGLVVSSEGGAESCLNTVIRENIFLYNWNGADRGPGYDAEIAHMNVEGLTIARNRYLAARTWIRQIGDGSRAVVEKDNADLSEAPVADPISVDGVVMRGNAVIGRLAMVSPEVGGQMAPS
ncbi:hypothetical protein HS125_04485 [bacterium]|nr:hypothetical protein [bacterium]